MSDGQSWTAPGGAPTPPLPVVQPPPAPYSDTAQPPTPPTASGWAPPPKPGLIPLRPMTLGAILGASFQVLRRNPRPTFGFSLLVTGVTYLLLILVAFGAAFGSASRINSSTAQDSATILAGTYALFGLLAIVPVLFSIVASAVLQGIISLEVARGTVGEKLRLPGLWRAARGRIGALIGWALLLSTAILVSVGLVVLVIALLAALGGPAGVAVAIILGVLAFMGALVVGFWLATKLSLVPSALMLERVPLRSAVVRSWSLTSGFFWRTLGIELLVLVIISTVSGIISTPLQLGSTIVISLANPNGDATAAIVGGLIFYGLAIVVTVVIGAIGAVIQSATAALIYIDLRMRKEGLDLELSRFVESRQSGAAVADPYLPRASAPQPPPPPAATSW